MIEGMSTHFAKPIFRVVFSAVILLLLVLAIMFGTSRMLAATEPVPADLTEDGVLTIHGEGSDLVRVLCDRDQLEINNAEPDTGAEACDAVREIVVLGEPMLDLQRAIDGSLPNLESIRVLRPDGSLVQSMRRASDTHWTEVPLALGPGASGQDSGQLNREYVGPKPLDTGINSPLAPPLGTTIEAANFDTNSTNTGGSYFIPPDPHAAAGPNHVVNVVNVSIEWYAKTGGAAQYSASLANFFASLPGALPYTFTFDPKVIYDQYNDRFVVVTLEHEDTGDGDPRDTSYIFVAVSDDNNPNGTWHQQVISTTIDVGGTDHWADYPGLAVDDEAIYITNNLFSFGANAFGGTRLWIIDKDAGSGGGLYNGGQSNVTIHDPIAASGLAGSFASTAQPAHMYGTAQGNTGTFLALYSGLTSGGNESLNVIRVDNSTTSPTFTQQFVAAGNIDNTGVVFVPDAPQLGSLTNIEVNDRRTLQAVWRDNNLYVSTTVVPGSGPDSGEATAHWFRVDTSSLGSLTVADQGDVGGEDIATDTSTFFPSIMVDQNGNMAIGFSASASTIYGGAYYTCKSITDPAGTVQSSGTLAAGTDWYVRTFGGSRNRWGDYSGMALDPSDEATFWVYNEYAITRGSPTFPSEDGRWGTRYGSFTCAGIGPTPTPPTPTPTSPPPTPTPIRDEFSNLPIIRKAVSAIPQVNDGGFEDGSPNSFWAEGSTNFLGVICDVSCNEPGGTNAPRTGIYWVWFGGITNAQEVGFVQQDVRFPNGPTNLTFWLRMSSPGTTGFMQVSVDGNPVFQVTDSDSASYPVFTQVVVDVSAYADGGIHTLQFDSTTNADPFGSLSFHLDDVAFEPQ